MWSQRLKIKACDENSDQQKFKYQDGRLFLEAYPRICVGWEVSTTGGFQKVSMTMMNCYHNNFARIEGVSSDGGGASEPMLQESYNQGYWQAQQDGLFSGEGYDNGHAAGYEAGYVDGANSVPTLPPTVQCGKMPYQEGTAKCCREMYLIPTDEECTTELSFCGDVAYFSDSAQCCNDTHVVSLSEYRADARCFEIGLV